jgi:hypothetical protein
VRPGSLLDSQNSAAMGPASSNSADSSSSTGRKPGPRWAKARTSSSALTGMR